MLLTQAFPLYRNIYDPAVVCLQDAVKTCGTSPSEVEVQEWAETITKLLTFICSEQGLQGTYLLKEHYINKQAVFMYDYCLPDADVKQVCNCFIVFESVILDQSSMKHFQIAKTLFENYFLSFYSRDIFKMARTLSCMALSHVELVCCIIKDNNSVLTNNYDS